MAFPKTQSGTDLMLEAPSQPDAEQYAELGLRFVGVEPTQTKADTLPGK
jgi:aspartyl-tRNA synthetase